MVNVQSILTVCQKSLRRKIIFRLSEYQKQLYDIINTDKIEIIPQSRKNETLRFIERGLEDLVYLVR